MSSQADAYCLQWRPEVKEVSMKALGLTGRVASCLLAPSSCRHPCALKHVSLSTGFSSSSFSFFPTDLGEGSHVDSTKMRICRASFSVGSSWSAGGQLDVLQYSSLDPLEWFLVLSCFLNRKFLTWEWLLGLGRWRTLWWIPQGTLVAALPLCIILSPSCLF